MGFFKQLGSFASAIWDRFSQAISPISEALSFGHAAGVEISPYDAVKELTHQYRQDDYASLVSALGPDDYIPTTYYTEAEIPWNRPFAYEVEFYGRDLETGRFAHTSRVITSSAELTIGEIEDIAMSRFASGGEYPQLDVYQMSVTGGEVRAGEVR